MRCFKQILRLNHIGFITRWYENCGYQNENVFKTKAHGSIFVTNIQVPPEKRKGGDPCSGCHGNVRHSCKVVHQNALQWSALWWWFHVAPKWQPRGQCAWGKWDGAVYMTTQQTGDVDHNRTHIPVLDTRLTNKTDGNFHEYLQHFKRRNDWSVYLVLMLVSYYKVVVAGWGVVLRNILCLFVQ
jgi:hypothetical protein